MKKKTGVKKSSFPALNKFTSSNFSFIKTERFFFLLTVASIVIQTGKHVWPPFSFVHGIRVDYLSPTLYVSDVFIILLAVIYAFRIHAQNKIKPLFGRRSAHRIVILLLIFLTIQTLVSVSLGAMVVSFAKLIEFSFFGYYVSREINKNSIPQVAFALCLGTVIVCILSIWEFIIQKSVNGIFYFLGERTFSGSTIGIANMNIDGRLTLRPYGTFPHPNVLAFFLLFVNVFLLSSLSLEKDKKRNVFTAFVISLSSCTLLLTFSRITIFISLILFLSYFFFSGFVRRIPALLTGLTIVGVLSGYFLAYGGRFLHISQALNLRASLIQIALQIFASHPIFGVGLNNFFLSEAGFQKSVSPVLLQPAHNVYLLTLAETGIFGFFFFIFFIILTIKNSIRSISSQRNIQKRRFHIGILFLIVSALIVGMFDHFFLTLQQGQMMISFIFGLAWAKKI